MYTKPKGLLPNITAFFGFAIPGISLIFYLPTLGEIIRIANFSIVDLTGGIVFTVVILFFPFYIGIFLASIFPDIKVDEHGIRYRYLEFFTGIIQWAEIERAAMRGEYLIVQVARPGLPLLNGLYFKSLLARVLGYSNPTIIISADSSFRDELLERITKMGRPY